MYPKRLFIFLLPIIFLCSFTFYVHETEQPGIYPLDHAERKAYLTRLIADFVSWPQNKNIAADSTFIVGVFKDDDFFKYLTYLYKDVEFKGMKAKVTLIDNVDNITNCHILFLTKASSESIDEILKLTNNRPILTIGDHSDFGTKGTIVNFYDEKDEVKFEININSYKNSELTIDSRLFDVAKIID